MSGVRGRGRSISTTSAIRPGPRAHHRDDVGQEDRLGDAVGDHQRGGRASRSRCAAARRSAAGGSCRPARRTARRAASPSACTTRQRAIATRWRIPPDSCAGLAFSKPCSPTSLIRSSIRPGSGVIPATSSGSRMLPLDACARAAAPPPGTRCRARGRAGSRAVDWPLISACRPSASPARRGCAGSSTCRSRTGRAATGTSSRAVPRSTSSSACTDLRPERERLAQTLDVDARSPPAARSPGRRC